MSFSFDHRRSLSKKHFWSLAKNNAHFFKLEHQPSFFCLWSHKTMFNRLETVTRWDKLMFFCQKLGWFSSSDIKKLMHVETNQIDSWLIRTNLLLISSLWWNLFCYSNILSNIIEYRLGMSISFDHRRSLSKKHFWSLAKNNAHFFKLEYEPSFFCLWSHKTTFNRLETVTIWDKLMFFCQKLGWFFSSDIKKLMHGETNQIDSWLIRTKLLLISHLW